MIRCKEGDLAVVLGGPYIGHFLTVGKFIGDSYVTDPRGNDGFQTNCWRITLNGDSSLVCPDAYLQPIRPGGTGITTETKKEITA